MCWVGVSINKQKKTNTGYKIVTIIIPFYQQMNNEDVSRYSQFMWHNVHPQLYMFNSYAKIYINFVFFINFISHFLFFFFMQLNLDSRNKITLEITCQKKILTLHYLIMQICFNVHVFYNNLHLSITSHTFEQNILSDLYYGQE